MGQYIHFFSYLEKERLHQNSLIGLSIYAHNGEDNSSIEQASGPLLHFSHFQTRSAGLDGK